MSAENWKYGSARSGSIERGVRWNRVTHEAQRMSKSAGDVWVSLGQRDSLSDAIAAAIRDIDRGTRRRGDTSKRS